LNKIVKSTESVDIVSRYWDWITLSFGQVKLSD